MEKEEKTTPETVDDVVDQEQEVISADDFQDSDDKKISFIGKVMDKLRGNPSEDVEDSDDAQDTDDVEEDTDETEDDQDKEDNSDKTDETEDDDTDELGIADIDNRLVMAAKRRGWSDSKIIKYFQEDKTVLEDIANLSEFQESQDEEDEDEEDVEIEASKKLEAIKFTDEQVAELRKEYGDVLVDTVILPMAKQNEQYAEVINKAQDNEQKRSENAKRKEELEFDSVFTQTLDEASKNYPQLGVWENVPCLPNGNVDLNCEMFQIRADLWDRAKFAKIVLGKSTKEAVEDALVYLKGTLKESEVKDRIVKDLNKRKQKMLNRPKRRKTQKTFKNKKEKIMHTMTEAFKDAGIE